MLERKEPDATPTEIAEAPRGPEGQSLLVILLDESAAGNRERT